MTFQFQCPHGHLLEGEPEQAGQQCHCPVCGILFIIPQPPPGVAPHGPFPGGFSFDQTPPAPDPPAPQAPQAPMHPPPPFGPTPGPVFPDIAEATPSGPHVVPEAPGPVREQEPEFLHIPCPNGHELETPLEMIGQDVLCPECSVQFKLRRKDSVEVKRQKQIEQEQRERKVGNWWFNFAIIVAVLVILGLLIMFIASR